MQSIGPTWWTPDKTCSESYFQAVNAAAGCSARSRRNGQRCARGREGPSPPGRARDKTSASGRRIESQPCREDHDDHILLQDQISMAAAVVMMVLGERTVPVVSGSRSLA